MTTKPAGLAFQPAPRPQPRVSPEQSRELADAARDLGFGRTTSAPDAEPTPVAQAVPQAAPAASIMPTPRPAKASAPAKAPQAAKAAAPTRDRKAALKIEMDDETWTGLRHEALNRRVTVKYLVMEALAEKGYAIDLTQVAEDGRRVR
jgi:hypothetical protein